jgi:hypothetical protein
MNLGGKNRNEENVKAHGEAQRKIWRRFELVSVARHQLASTVLNYGDSSESVRLDLEQPIRRLAVAASAEAPDEYTDMLL